MDLELLLIQRILGVLVPFFVLLTMPELWKNKITGSMEIECTTLYSLRQVYAARMVLFALADLLLITVFLSVTLVTLQMHASELVIQFFIPFDVTCCICFRSLYSRHFDSGIFSLFLCMFFITIWVKIVLNERVYEAVTMPVWGILLLISLLWLYGCIRKVWENCERMPCC